MIDIATIMGQLEEVVGKKDASAPTPYVLSTSLENINLAISGDRKGGFPGGRIITVAGPESSGKTALATELMIQAQQKNGIAFFEDFEHAFHEPHAVRQGLDVARFYRRKPNWAEEGFEHIYKLVDLVRSSELKLPLPTADEKDEKTQVRRMALWEKLRVRGLDGLMPICGTMDSIASMIPRSQDISFKNQNMKTKNMDLPAMLSLELKRLARDAENCGATVVMLNQLRTNPGVMFGDSTTEPGGNAPRFYASVMIRLRRVDKLYRTWGDKTSEVIGDIVELYTRKNKTYRPFKKTRYVFRTVDPVGLDPFLTMIYLGKEAGILGAKTGKTVDLSFMGRGKREDIDAVEPMFRTDPSALAKLTDYVLSNTVAVIDGPAVDDEKEDEGPFSLSPELAAQLAAASGQSSE